MARRLEGRIFYTDHNNGVAAIATEEAAREVRRLSLIAAALATYHPGHLPDEKERRAIVSALDHLRLPVFTFAKPERVREQLWFTGDFKLLQVLCDYIREEGGSELPGDFYVPFSNGFEVNLHGLEAMESELRFVTTRRQFRDTFGVSYDELLERVREAERGMGAT